MYNNGGQRSIGGRYVLLEPLGSGGMGSVWRAHDQLLERRVAVKEVHVHNPGEDLANRVRRASREARTVARVSHPNVVDIYDLVHEDDRLWLVMELVEGQSLAGHLATHGTLSVSQAADIGRQLLDALGAVHAEGALHRDVKPANVVLHPSGRAVLCDFGIAYVADGDRLTASGALVGSVDFMAPERLLSQQVGPPSDLFSLGITLCWLVSGRSPFPRPEPAAVMHAVAYEDADIPDVLGSLRPLVEGLLRKDPAARPGVAEAAAVLGTVPAPTPQQPPQLLSPDHAHGAGGDGKRRRWIPWVAALAALAVVGSIGAYHAMDDELPATRPFSAADAVLPLSNGDGRYWMFRGDSCTLMQVSDVHGRPEVKQLTQPVPLREWAPSALNTEPFRTTVDAAVRTPDNTNQYWLFSGNRYVRVQLSGTTEQPEVTAITRSQPLSNWDPAFAKKPFSHHIDAVLQMWNRPNEYKFFSGDRYVHITVQNSTKNFNLVSHKGPMPFNKDQPKPPAGRVDAVLPSPRQLTDTWLLSGSSYVRLRFEESNDSVPVAGPYRLNTSWTP